NHAERLAVLVPQRRAHDRANPKIGDALRHVEALVLAGIVTEEGFAFSAALADDGPAIAGARFVLRPPRLDDPRDQAVDGLLALGHFFAHDDEATVRLLEDLKQVVHDLRQQVVHLQAFAQAPADVENNAEPFRRLRFQ